MSPKIEYISKPTEVSMHDDWFEIAGTDHFWMIWRFRELIKKVNFENSDFKILEVGCGSGTVMEQFERERNLSIDGCDLNDYALKLIKSEKSKCYCYNIYDKNPQIVGKYNVILLLDVIEHIDDHVGFINTCKDHLTEEGKIIINVPAYMHLYSKYDKEVGHVRRYNKKTLSQALKDAGLEVESCSYWGMLLYPIAVIRKFWISTKKENIIKEGMQPPGKLTSFILSSLMNIETKLPLIKPFGTSLLAVGNKSK